MEGTHRRAAIEKALQDNPSLSNETIAVVFFRDKGLKKSQQMFSDLNRHAIRPATSIARLYDHRDPVAEVIRRVVYETEVFKGVVEMERSTIAERSSKLFHKTQKQKFFYEEIKNTFLNEIKENTRQYFQAHQICF